MDLSLRIPYDVHHVPGDARALAQFAHEAEKLGVHALYLNDHLIHSAPAQHSATAAGVIASATDKVRIGFASYILPLRHPVIAAKELGMLDFITNGRLIAGVAAGSYEAEFSALGLRFHERGRMLDEALEVILALWTKKGVTYRGDYWSFDNITLSPSCVQEPHPPIRIGSWTASPRAARRIARFAEGWQISARNTDVGSIPEGWASIVSACEKVGRDPLTIRRTYMGALTAVLSGTDSHVELAVVKAAETANFSGTPDEVVRQLNGMKDSGIDEVSLTLPTLDIKHLKFVGREVISVFANEGLRAPSP